MGRLFNCQHCKKSFGTKATLKRHLNNPKLTCSRAEQAANDVKINEEQLEKDLEEVVLTEMVTERTI